MKTIHVALLVCCCFFSSIAMAQTVQDSTVTIQSRTAGKITGKIISESKDTIRLQSPDFGVVSIAKNEIIYSDRVSIETKDGNEFIGTIEAEDEKSVTIKTSNLGEVTIQKTDIVSQKNIDSRQMKRGEFWAPNPQASRYFWSPNAYGLKKGEGYYQNIWVLWNQVAYGVTDNFSIGGGVIPLFLFSGAPTPVFATAKFSVPVSDNKVNLGGGAILGTILGNDDGGFGILYGNSTFGSRDNNVTFGLGYGFADGEWANAPVLTFSGMFRISRRGYILTENYFLSTDSEAGALISIGGRSILGKAAIDYGIFVPIGVGGFYGFPWLGFTVPFGKV